MKALIQRAPIVDHHISTCLGPHLLCFWRTKRLLRPLPRHFPLSFLPALQMGNRTKIAHLGEALVFSAVPDDILSNILCRLGEDPRDLARLACVSTRFCKMIKTVCWKFRCKKMIPLLVADLLLPPFPSDPSSEPPGGWASLQKLLVCCPGLLHAGVFLDNCGFGFERELGRFDFGVWHARNVADCTVTGAFSGVEMVVKNRNTSVHACNGEGSTVVSQQQEIGKMHVVSNGSSAIQCDLSSLNKPPNDSRGLKVSTAKCGGEFAMTSNGSGTCGEEGTGPRRATNGHVTWQVWDLSTSKSQSESLPNMKALTPPCHESGKGLETSMCIVHEKRNVAYKETCEMPVRIDGCHVTSGPWNLSREQGNKLLANRFRADILYISEWPGCLHSGDRREYKLFRGVFKNFKTSHVWRNLKDVQAAATGVGCAFCGCKSTWDMVTAFCLKRSIEHHDDGEPVVRAYVCENGHIAGAWTDRPMYTL